jgi:hypothetical protein
VTTTTPSPSSILINTTLNLSPRLETQTPTLRLPKPRRRVPIATPRTAGAARNSRKPLNASAQRQVNAVGSALVHDIEEQTHATATGVVVGVVVVSGEIAAPREADALVLGAETRQSVFGEGELDGGRGRRVAEDADVCDCAAGVEAGIDGVGGRE